VRRAVPLAATHLPVPRTCRARIQTRQRVSGLRLSLMQHSHVHILFRITLGGHPISRPRVYKIWDTDKPRQTRWKGLILTLTRSSVDPCVRMSLDRWTIQTSKYSLSRYILLSMSRTVPHWSIPETWILVKPRPLELDIYPGYTHQDSDMPVQPWGHFTLGVT
jgi:hypothetical protein